MLQALNYDPEADAEEILSNVLTEINTFAGDMPQFDDITMLCLKYCGIQKKDHPEEYVLKTDAKTECLGDVLAFIEEHLKAAGCSPKTQTQICVAAEEVFVNIASYAFPDCPGNVMIRLWFEDGSRKVAISFADEGIPYNPLTRETPDITLDTKERSIGGLGIYMVRQMMDEVFYEHKDGQNQLTFKKMI